MISETKNPFNEDIAKLISMIKGFSPNQLHILPSGLISKL
jgi:hypothetical protein